jgi:hypothetical protein
VTKRIRTVLFACAVLAAACGTAKKPDLPPQVWTSETTGNDYSVRIEGDVFRADWVNLPPAMAKQGVYLRTECHRMGSKWVGVSDSRLPCSVGAEANDRVIRWCQLRTRIEIDSMAPDRITGQAEGLKRVDCQECKILESGWKDFVWVPKR